MATKRSEKRNNELKREAEPVRQRSQRDVGSLDKVLTKLIDQNSFDKISVYLVVIGLSVTLVIWPFTQENLFRLILGSMAVVFTLLSVRESKRDREMNVAPTLFVGERNKGEYGILNLGDGPAHELLVKVATDRPDDWDDVEPELDGEILRVDGFLTIDGEPNWVKMDYRSNVGKKYNYTREVLPNDED